MLTMRSRAPFSFALATDKGVSELALLSLCSLWLASTQSCSLVKLSSGSHNPPTFLYMSFFQTLTLQPHQPLSLPSTFPGMNQNAIHISCCMPLSYGMAPAVSLHLLRSDSTVTFYDSFLVWITLL